MKKIRAAIVGYGNIGKYVLEALQAAPDFEIAGIVRRDANNVPDELREYPVVEGIENLQDVAVAILCTPTRKVEDFAIKALSLGINTVDSFDIHTQIADLRSRLDAIAKKHNSVSITAAGWDPGSDSIVRALMEACAPKGITYTNFGPGMSGTHCCRKSRRRRKSRIIYDNSSRNRNPPTNGIYRIERRLQIRRSC